METKYYIYILTNKTHSTLYIGVTNNIERRYIQHINKIEGSFTERYNLNKLIYYEEYESIKEAIRREKQLKNWRRKWKENLIKEVNPDWNDLTESSP